MGERIHIADDTDSRLVGGAHLAGIRPSLSGFNAATPSAASRWTSLFGISNGLSEIVHIPCVTITASQLPSRDSRLPKSPIDAPQAFTNDSAPSVSPVPQVFGYTEYSATQLTHIIIKSTPTCNVLATGESSRINTTRSRPSVFSDYPQSFNATTNSSRSATFQKLFPLTKQDTQYSDTLITIKPFILQMTSKTNLFADKIAQYVDLDIWDVTEPMRRLAGNFAKKILAERKSDFDKLDDSDKTDVATQAYIKAQDKLWADAISDSNIAVISSKIKRR